MLPPDQQEIRQPTRGPRRIFCLLAAAFAFGHLTNGAHAADQAAPAADCHQYDRFIQLGAEDPATQPCMTIDPELGGLRKALADYGFGFSVNATTLYNYNLRNDRGPTQLYGGQKPTYATLILPVITYDLSRLGFNDGSQFVFKPAYGYNSYENNGVTGTYVNQLSARFPLWDNRIIIQGGVYYMGAQFYGSNIGDISGAAVLGSSSGLPFEAGINGWLPTPGVDIRFQTPDGRFYNHLGFSRSLSPLGPIYEADHNPTGLKFHIKDSRLAVIDEVGYRVPSAPGQHKIWLRGGVIYNNSQYTMLASPSDKDDNYAFYGILDYQLTQPDSSLPFKGWYINLKGDYGNPSVNAFTGDIGATLYNVGPFPSRPFDLFAVSVGRNFISHDAVDFYRDLGLDPARGITTASASYAFLVTRGIYWNNTFAYTSTPTVVPQRESSYSVISSISLQF